MKKLLYIDLFCGAGGTSTGVESATINGQKCAHVIACVNHDPHAIASHLANHPEAKHYTEDISTLDLTTLVEHTTLKRAEYPESLLVLWASLECTNFSRAKGGHPRDADSRTLAEHLFRYIDALKPDYIQIENVREFMMWGDLDENGKPVSKDAGRLYLRWVRNVCKRGYDFQHRILNAANYGAYTTRERFFGIFARKGLPIVFPEPTYSKDAGQTLFDEMKPWRPVREVLDLEDCGRSIFREKPLSEKTLQRIYAGLVKFVAGGKDAFLVKWNSMSRKGVYHAPSIDEPCPVVATQNRLGLAKVSFLSKQFSGKPEEKNIGINGPAGTITCIDHHAFITAYYGNGGNTPIDQPAPTVTTKDRLGFVKMQFMDQQYGTGRPATIDRPAGTVTTNPKLNLISVKPWIMDTSFDNIGSSIDEPSRVITANHKWQYLVNPQFASAGASIDKPCFTLIARMDKRPPYIVSAETGPAIAIYYNDSPMTVKIKEFMSIYGISDICMRMLKISELKRIMGFPEDYVLVGTQTEMKKYIGNAVEVNMASCLCAAIYKAVAS
jgi:DNA (cytosine-5)-methyltransferase 1